MRQQGWIPLGPNSVRMHRAHESDHRPEGKADPPNAMRCNAHSECGGRGRSKQPRAKLCSAAFAAAVPSLPITTTCGAVHSAVHVSRAPRSHGRLSGHCRVRTLHCIASRCIRCAIHSTDRPNLARTRLGTAADSHLQQFPLSTDRPGADAARHGGGVDFDDGDDRLCLQRTDLRPQKSRAAEIAQGVAQRLVLDQRCGARPAKSPQAYSGRVRPSAYHSAASR
jgi:hypothetical protein